jgi:hypothetical protein
MDERDLLIAWRNIFQADGVNDESLAKADELLEEVSGESPLHLRLANELAELKKRHASTSRK